MSGIPSPYNFVPLSKEVFFPEWADLVSHDVPFSDGISGRLEIEVKVLPPLYIRNSGDFSEEDNTLRNKNPEFTSFFKMGAEGNYYIPGSSLKGMLRNIVEIISFGKMAPRVDDSRYGIRDLYYDKYTKEITEEVGLKAYRSKAKAGWLSRKGETWQIIPCDYGRVEQEDLEKYYRQKNPGESLSIGREREEARKKYEKWQHKMPLEINCRIDKEEQPYPHSPGTLKYKKVSDLGKGDTEGTLVFTGQPMKRVSGKSGCKHMEFIFFNPDVSHPIEIGETLFSDFEFIHSYENGTALPVWAFLKEKKNIPVFYLEDDKGKLKSLGLAQMYRLPYKLTIHEAIMNTGKKHIEPEDKPIVPDLSDLIFGYVSDKNSLKGRVHIGHLKSIAKPGEEKLTEIIPGNPKPTYYPNYIKQRFNPEQVKNRNITPYETLMDEKAEIRGWKRYPVKKKHPLAPVSRENTAFKALSPGAVFKGSITLHNLRPQELGALYWALTWGGDSRLKHNLGMAKPYGFGQVEISIKKNELKGMKRETPDPGEILSAFTKKMEEKIPGWNGSDQLKELTAMADPERSGPFKLAYPALRNTQGRNEFVDYKNKRNPLFLANYTDYEESPPFQSGGKTSTYKAQAFRSGSPRVRESAREPLKKDVDYRTDQKVKCLVLEEKTKKGGWRLRIIGGGEEDLGVLKPQTPEPEDMAPGKEYTMIIRAYARGNCQFEWVRE